MEDDLIAVENILLQAQDAPKYGLNSRELVLRAAHVAVHGPTASHSSAPSDAGPPCKTGTPSNKQQGQQACSWEAAEQLVQSLTVHERPLVQYIARSAVPRIARQVGFIGQGDGPMLLCIAGTHAALCMQGVAHRLAGLHMANLLQRAGLPVSAAGLQHTDAAPIRKAGVAAALAQELNLYKMSNSKQAFPPLNRSCTAMVLS